MSSGGRSITHCRMWTGWTVRSRPFADARRAPLVMTGRGWGSHRVVWLWSTRAVQNRPCPGAMLRPLGPPPKETTRVDGAGAVTAIPTIVEPRGLSRQSSAAVHPRRGPAITGIDSPHLRGACRLSTERHLHDPIAWELGGNGPGN